ncbi:MAG: AI-2E family transporter [Planctomycetaceae bacterium]|nr:AI-2E family transporter [Planctomycetaceae bacterium]
MNSEKNVIEDSGIFGYGDLDKPVSRASRVPKALFIGAATVIILAGIQAASILVGPLLLALFLAIVLLVPLRWLQQRGVPHFLAFTIVMVCSIALFSGILYFIGGSMYNFIGQIPAITKQVDVKYKQFQVQLERQFGDLIGNLQEPKNGQEEPQPGQPIEPVPSEPLAPAPVPPEIVPPVVAPKPAITDEAIDPDSAEPPESDTEGTDESHEATPTPVVGEGITPLSPEERDDLIRRAEESQPSLFPLDPQSAALWLTRIALYAQRMFEGGFLVILFTVFMLLEATNFPSKVKRALGKDSPINIEHFHRIAEDVRRYLILKTVSNLMSATAAFGVYHMFGVEEAFFWGIVAFFMYYIPNLGGTLAAIIPGLLIFISNDVSWVLLYALCLLTVECTIAYGIEPKLLGHGLRLSVLVIILSLFFWGFMLGPIGLFLAAPIMVMIKIILQAFPETRWIAIFLEGGRAEKH